MASLRLFAKSAVNLSAINSLNSCSRLVFPQTRYISTTLAIMSGKLIHTFF